MIIRFFLLLFLFKVILSQWGPPPGGFGPGGFGPSGFWPMTFEEKIEARSILDNESRDLTFAPRPLKRMLRNYCRQSHIGHPRCEEVFRFGPMRPHEHFGGPPPNMNFNDERWNGPEVRENEGWDKSFSQTSNMQLSNINSSPNPTLANGFTPPTAPSIPDPPGSIDSVPRVNGSHIQSSNQPNMLFNLPNELSSSQRQLDLVYSWGNMEQNVQQTFKKTCNNLKKEGKFNCLNNNIPKYKNKKSNIMEFELATIPGVNINILNEKYKKTHEVKQSVLSANNLGNDVKAIEDGTYQDDMLLTNEQSNYLINQIKRKMKKRKKRNGYFIDKMITNKWPNPLNIPYVLDTTLNNIEKKYIQDALKQIETGTCVKFTNIPFNRKPLNTYILYKKTLSATFCGLSYIGRVSPFNPIYLSFSPTCKNPVGTIIHETMHTLGIAHQHSRVDRDQFVKINWENVNPQFYDMFAINDPKQFSTYGVSYDYYSIMHYNFNIAAIDDKKPTITPLKQSERFINVIGQRERLSDKDRELLKIMYCSGTCKDTNVYCGFWALKEFCHKSSVNTYMNNNCKKSCGFCH